MRCTCGWYLSDEATSCPECDREFTNKEEERPKTRKEIHLEGIRMVLDAVRKAPKDQK